MDAAGEFPDLVERVGQAVREACQLLLQLGLIRRHSFLGKAELQGQRHQTLLDAVVEVAFDPAPGLVGGGDHAGAGGGELGLAHGVGDGGGRELREPEDPGLGVVGKRLGLLRAGPDRPPDGPVDDNRRADRRVDTHLPREPRDRAGKALVVSDPDREAGPQHPGLLEVVPHLESHADRKAAAFPMRFGHQRQGLVGLVPGDAAQVGPEQPNHFLGHRREDIVRSCLSRHERGDPAQGSLLLGEALEHRRVFAQRRKQAGVLSGLAVALLTRGALVVEQAQHAHRQRRHAGHAGQQAGLRSAEALGPRPREDEDPPGRVLERHPGRQADPGARDGEHTAAVFGHGVELGGRRGPFGVPDDGQDLAATDDRRDLRAECLRRPFDRSERRRGFRPTGRDRAEKLGELLGGPERLRHPGISRRREAVRPAMSSPGPKG